MGLPLDSRLQKKMKKTILFWIIGIIIISTMVDVNAEISSYGISNINKEQNTWTQQAYMSYEAVEGMPNSAEKLTLKIGCEDIGQYNSNRPYNNVKNVSLRTLHYKQDSYLGDDNYAYIFESNDYGCSDNSPTCDYTNTPPSTTATDWQCTIASWIQFWRYDEFHCTTSTIGQVEIPATMKKGETLLLQLVTYFNTTNGAIDDSPCRFSVAVNSRNCKGCEGKTFEEVTNELENNQASFEVKSTVYGYVTQIIDINFEIWTIIYYIVNIGVFIGAIIAMIYAVIWIYLFIKYELGKR